MVVATPPYEIKHACWLCPLEGDQPSSMTQMNTLKRHMDNFHFGRFYCEEDGCQHLAYSKGALQVIANFRT